MKTRSCSLARFLSILFLAASAVTPPASAQPRPSLGLQFASGQPTLTLAGAVGTVYSIQYATGLSSTNLWWIERWCRRRVAALLGVIRRLPRQASGFTEL